MTPGFVRTEGAHAVYGDDTGAVEAVIPMRRLAQPSDVAAACLMLASPAAAYVTGAELVVDGGGEVPAFVTAMRAGKRGVAGG